MCSCNIRSVKGRGTEAANLEDQLWPLTSMPMKRHQEFEQTDAAETGSEGSKGRYLAKHNTTEIVMGSRDEFSP